MFRTAATPERTYRQPQNHRPPVEQWLALSQSETVARMDAGDKPTGTYLRRVSDWLSASHCDPAISTAFLSMIRLSSAAETFCGANQPASNPELGERIGNLPKNPRNPRMLGLKLEHGLLQLIVSFACWRA